MITIRINVEFPEIKTLEFRYKVTFVPDVTQCLKILQTNLQGGKKKLIPHVTSDIFAIEQKLEM